jgi:hypothetical protein
MKPGFWLVAFASVSVVCGCSKTQTVRIMASSWNLGQHFDCLYDKGTIYCIPPSAKRVGRYPLEGWSDKSGQPMARTTVLINVGANIINYMERHRAEIEEDKSADTGIYETRFSTSLGIPDDTDQCSGACRSRVPG